MVFLAETVGVVLGAENAASNRPAEAKANVAASNFLMLTTFNGQHGSRKNMFHTAIGFCDSFGVRRVPASLWDNRDR